MLRMLEGKKILITGGAGFIGSNLCESLVQTNQVLCMDNLSTGKLSNIEHLIELNNFTFIESDIRDLEACKIAVKDVDIVFHQAALGSVPRSIEHPIRTNDNNITGFLNILQASTDEKVDRFIYAASSSTYGDHPALPKVEENIGKPLSPYAVTKYVNELYAQVFSDLYGIKTIGLRYFNVFGKRQDPNGAYAAVIPKFVNALLNKDKIIINGDGEQMRDFTHIDNVVKANILAATVLKPEAMNTIYNVAFGSTISLNNLVQVIEKAFNAMQINIGEICIEHGPNRLGDIKNSYASIQKAHSLLGYNPTVNLEEGINRYLKFVVENKTHFE